VLARDGYRGDSKWAHEPLEFRAVFCFYKVLAQPIWVLEYVVDIGIVVSRCLPAMAIGAIPSGPTGRSICSGYWDSGRAAMAFFDCRAVFFFLELL
jgi:hypothetical protein